CAKVRGKVRARARYGCARLLALTLVNAALLLAGCGQSPRGLATRYLADLQQFNYPACYATLTNEDRAARTLTQFLTEIPLAPDVDPIWFRAILFSTRYEVGQPQINGERAVVPVKVTMPDLTLWERTIDAKAGPQDSLNAAADKSLEGGLYPKLRFEDALVIIKQQHQWRVVADFARRDLIRDGNREAVGIYHSQDYPKAAAAYQALIAQLDKHEFSGSRGLVFFFKRRLKAIEDIQARVPAARAYFPKLVLSDVAVKMSEARVPAIFGRITNAGDRGVDEVRLTVTFYAGRGVQRKLLYQESHSVVVTPIEFTGFIRPVLPFVPGETRDFGFELIAPAQIQQQSEPSLTVGSMVFTQSKAPLPSLAIENLTAAPQPSGSPSSTPAASAPPPSPRPRATPGTH
ncbi:MAG TPA: hypothetical protein VNF49_02290, partial [Candidatus Binataceae bacterium]|nr:hypothetical protein [Candidatus Binataceae bacterium]